MKFVAKHSRYAMIAAIVTAGLALGSCSSTPQQDGMVRTSVKTAPADLQLLCASAVASQSGVDSSKVLPVSSRQIDSQNYQVELEAAGSRSSCIVDTDGNVTSVQPA